MKMVNGLIHNAEERAQKMMDKAHHRVSQMFSHHRNTQLVIKKKGEYKDGALEDSIPEDDFMDNPMTRALSVEHGEHRPAAEVRRLVGVRKAIEGEGLHLQEVPE